MEQAIKLKNSIEMYNMINVEIYQTKIDLVI